MALILKDRVLESSTSTGTGSFTLTGAQTGYQSFSAIGNGNTTYYTIQGKNPDGTLTSDWEVGLGTYTASGTTLSRDTVLSNSLGTTALINFSAGTKDVFVTYPSGKALLGSTSAVSSTGTGSVVLNTSPTLVTPVLGTPTSATLTNATGLPIEAGTTGTLSVARGGTGVTTSTGTGSVVLSASPTLTGTLSAATITASTDATINTIRVGRGTGTGNGSNTTVGQSALQSNTTGSDNTAVGFSALTQNQGGNENVAVGRLALRENTTGNTNAALGRDALRRNTTGSSNTAFGNLALTANTISNSSVALGTQALFTFNGTTTAGDNTAVGGFALSDLTTGVQNTAIGNTARTLNVTDNNSIVIGYNQRGLGSNTTSIGNVNTTTARIFGNLSSTGTFSPQQATTAAAPAYVKGAIYFDTTLNKLRVGGATGWETITSV